MTALVVIFSVIATGVIVLTFRTSARLEKSKTEIDDLRRRIDP